MSLRDPLRTMLRWILGRPAATSTAPLHLPDAHQVAGEQLRIAAQLETLKRTPTYQRLEAEAALREYERTRRGEHGGDR